jgi:Uncharacterized alpha/beta hydrolase domain (DUF2235)
MPKAIALFIDGTWNSSVAVRKAKEAALARNDMAAFEEEAAADTNVAKLYDACALTPSGLTTTDRSAMAANVSQRTSAAAVTASALNPAGIKKYLVGVGGLPEEPQGGLARAAWDLLRQTVRPDALTGGAFGMGLARIIKDAYTFLCQNYQDGDAIYIFGFSRGAYAARSLAGFVDRIGLLLSNHTEDHIVEAAFMEYQAGIVGHESDLANLVREVSGQRLLREGKLMRSDGEKREYELPIYFIGVWDTVASLGLDYLPWIGNFTRPLNAYHRVDLPVCVTHARHAIALHELRGAFRPMLWHYKTRNGQTLEQTVFRGAHADVGGGYANTHWSDHALRWMATEAILCALPVADAMIPPLDPPNDLRFIHCESAKWWWRRGSRNRIPEFSACPIPLRFHWNSTLIGLNFPRVHDSVFRELREVQVWGLMRQDLQYTTDAAGNVSLTHSYGSAVAPAQVDANRPLRSPS